MINCNALHILHYKCIEKYIKSGKRECPFDRKSIDKCIHNGEIKELPQIPKKKQLT